MRDTTERPEAVEAGAVRLVGTSERAIIENVAELLTDEFAYGRCQIRDNPYGDGKAAQRIVGLLRQRAWEATAEPIRVAA
jgi:UDP-N-acetylglucosamine 2-epimerase (non-hydrolysing)